MIRPQTLMLKLLTVLRDIDLWIWRRLENRMAILERREPRDKPPNPL
jgi:hypothetical protein